MLRIQPIHAVQRALLCLLVLLLVSASVQAAQLTAAQAEPPDDLKNLSSQHGESALSDVALAAGRAYVVWQDRGFNGVGSSDVLLAISEDEGQTWLPQRRHLSGVGGADAVHPSIAAVGEDVYVVWEQGTEPYGPSRGAAEIGFATSGDGGRTWTRMEPLSTGRVSAADPEVVASGDGVHVAWTDYSGKLWLRSSFDRGASFEQPRLVATGVDYATKRPALAVDSGSLHLAWSGRDGTTGGRQVLASSTPAVAAGAEDEDGDGDPTDDRPETGTPFVVHRGTNVGDVSLAASGDALTVAWRGYDTPDRITRAHVAASVDRARESWSITTLSPAKRHATALALTGDGRDVVVSVETSGLDDAATWVAISSDSGRTFAEPVRAGGRSSTGTSPHLAVARDARAGTEPAVAFDWTAVSRFGADADGDGLVDYHDEPGELDPTHFSVDLSACGSTGGDARVTGYRWVIDGGEETAETTRCTFRKQFLSEGEHSVEVTVTTADGDTATATHTVEVEDLLVVSVGDSVASGEGNPDVPAADPWPWSDAARWQDRRCNRSAFAGPARAAALLEQRDPKTSVTFLHLACSGATVRAPDANPTDLSAGGLLSPYEGIDPASPPLPPQMDEVERLTAGRQVDALTVSIGANDLKFSDVVKDCIVTDCTTGPTGERFDARYAELPSHYVELDERIADLGIPDQRVFITEYFNPTQDDEGDYNLWCVGNPQWQPLFRVTHDETQWAHGTVVGRLNAAVHAAAGVHGWNLVDGIAEPFERHGYCANDSWVVQLGQSFSAQGGKDGAFHPNRPGHDLYGGRLAAAIAARIGHGDAPVVEAPADADPADGPADTRSAVHLVWEDARTAVMRRISLTASGAHVGAARRLDTAAGPGWSGGAIRADASPESVVASWTEDTSEQPNGRTGAFEVFARRVPAGPPNLRVLEVEPVQVAEGAGALVAGKATAARVVVRNGFDETKWVQAKLTWSQEGAETRTETHDIGIAPGRSELWLHPARGESPFTPATDAESVTVTVELDSTGAVGESDETDNELTSGAVRVATSRTLRVLYVPLGTSPEAAPSCPEVRRFAQAADAYLGDALPVPDGAQEHAVSCSATYRSGSALDWRGQSRLLAGLGTLARLGGYDHVVGVAPSGWFAANTDASEAIAVALLGAGAGTPPPGIIAEVSAPPAAVAHEIGHTLGQRHLEDAQEVRGYAVAARQPRAGRDVMADSVGVRSWIGAGTHDRLLQALQLTAPHSGTRAATGSLLVSGTIDADGEAQADAWHRDAAPADAPVEGSPVTVEARSADGTVLATTPIGAFASVHLGAEAADPGVRTFVARVPWVEGTAELAVRDGGDVVLRRPVSANAPTVEVTAPSGGSATALSSLTVSWTAQDADGDALSAIVERSTDGGATWQAATAQISGSSAELAIDRSLVGSALLLRVRVSDGIHSTVAEAPGAVSVTAPGGRPDLLVYDTYDGESGKRFAVHTVRSDGSGIEQISATDRNAGAPTWSPDGDRIAFLESTTDCGIRSGCTSIVTTADDGTDRAVVLSGPTWWFSLTDGLSWSSTGRIVFTGYRGDDGGVWTVPVSGDGRAVPGAAPVRVAPDGYEIPKAARWLPDGERFVYWRNRVGLGSDIGVRAADGTGEVTLTAGYTTNDKSRPDPSPDGSRIAFTATPFETSTGPLSKTGVYTMAADGTDLQLVLDQGFGDVDAPVWSGDGTRLALPYRYNNELQHDIVIFDADRDWSTGEGVRRLETPAVDERRIDWRAGVAPDEEEPPAPEPAAADAGGPYEAEQGGEVALDASASALLADPAVVLWDLDGDGAHDDAAGVGPVVPVTGAAGERTVSVEVVTADGRRATDTAAVVIENAAPTLHVPAELRLPAGATAMIAGAARDPGGDPVRVAVSFLDEQSEPAVDAETGAFLVEAGFEPGTMPVTVEACDPANACTRRTLQVITDPALAPRVGAIEPRTGPAAGGTVVEVHGVGFSVAEEVLFGDVAATEVEVVNDRVLLATAPALPPDSDHAVTVVGPSGSGGAVDAASYRADGSDPSAGQAEAVTDAGVAVEVDLPADDADGDLAEVRLVDEPRLGSVTIAGQRATYRAAAGVHGVERLAYVAVDATGRSAVGLLTVTVRRLDAVEQPLPEPPAMPTTANDCKKGGWQRYGVFSTQGDCVSYVSTGGRNLPAGR